MGLGITLGWVCTGPRDRVKYLVLTRASEEPELGPEGSRLCSEEPAADLQELRLCPLGPRLEVSQPMPGSSAKAGFWNADSQLGLSGTPDDCDDWT